MTLTLPFDLGPAAAAFAGLALLVAAYVRGYAGFGSSALLVTACALVTSPANVVPVAILYEVAATAGQARRAWAHVDWRLAGLVLAGALVAMPASVWLLKVAGVDQVRFVVSAFVLVMCLALLAGWRLKRRPGAAATAGVGVVSGLANGAAVGGLPVVVFLSASDTAPQRFRATMIAYLCTIDIVAIAIMAAYGLIGRDTLLATAYGLPILFFGVYAGGARFAAASPDSFRRFATLLLIALALAGLAKSLGLAP